MAECSRGREITVRMPSNDLQRFATVFDGILRVYGAWEGVTSLHNRPAAAQTPQSDREVLRIHLPSPAPACDAWGRLVGGRVLLRPGK